MKQQTFIVYLEDKNLKMVTFERFSCRRLETVINQMQELLKNSLYRACTKEAVSVAIYKTPNGYTKDPAPCCCFNIKKEV